MPDVTHSAPSEGLLARIAARLTYADALVLVTGAAMLLVATVASGRLHDDRGMPLALAASLALMVVGIRFGQSGRPRRDALTRLAGYLAWIWFFHATAGVLIGGLHLPRYERELASIDVALFGQPLTVTAQALATPLLTEVTQFAYNLYYFAVLALPLTLALQGRRQAFFETAAVLLTVHCLVVIGTLALPALWPTLAAADPSLAGVVHFDGPVTGLALTDALRTMTATGTTHIYDAFPSGHTAMTIATVLLTARYLRRYLWFLAPHAILIVFGTIYLRYHYAIDIVAGAALALAVTSVVRRRFAAAPALEPAAYGEGAT